MIRGYEMFLYQRSAAAKGKGRGLDSQKSTGQEKSAPKWALFTTTPNSQKAVIHSDKFLQEQ